MITAYLQGGLGNFLFQISAAISLASNNNDYAIFSSERAFIVHEPINKYLDNIFLNIKFQKEAIPVYYQYNEPAFEYQPIPYKPNLMLYGYFQSEKYFNTSLINDVFSIPFDIETQIKNKYSSILSNNTCSIHVRHGDYIRFPEHHPLCTLKYYNDAMQLMPPDTKFLIFSDNIKWCKENFIGDQFIFIEDQSDVYDLYLMSLCNNNIIANSSFSWWAGWLNKNPNKIVVTPNTWFGSAKQHLNLKDLIPSSWISI